MPMQQLNSADPLPIDLARARYPDLGEQYESMIDALADAFIRPSDIVVDGGANMGRHTRPFARRVLPGGHVHAFEPIPAVAERNCQALRGMKLDHAVTMHAAALWNAPGMASFAHFPNKPGRSSLRPGRVDDEPLRIEVPLVTLDSCLSHQPVAFMKLDVEGAEFHALRGARTLLSRGATLTVFENGLAGTAKLFDYSPEEFLDFFKSIDHVLIDGFGDQVSLETFNIKYCGWYFVAIPRREGLLGSVFAVLDRFWGLR